MKIIPCEKKEQVLAFFHQRPVPSFTEIAKQTGVNRVTIYHWYAKFEEGDISWCTRGKRSFKHYLSHIKKAVVQAYMEGNHNLESLVETYGLRSASTVLAWVWEYKKTIEDGTPLIQRKGWKHHMEHRDSKSMTEREIKIENLFFRTYIDGLLKEVPDDKKELQTRLEEQLKQNHCILTSEKFSKQ